MALITPLTTTSADYFSQPKRGTLTPDTPDAVVNSDAGAPKVPHDGSPGAQAARVRDDLRVVISGWRSQGGGPRWRYPGADQDGALWHGTRRARL